MAKHSRKQRFQILKKEIKDVKTDIKQAENKLLSLRERLAGRQGQFFLGKKKSLVLIDFPGKQNVDSFSVGARIGKLIFIFESHLNSPKC